ncbi:MAG: protein kinase domain-containing protein [Ktedonobacteraceae bacterium]
MKNDSISIGKHFGKYQVKAKIACGASGCVYLAQHEILAKRIAAIKVMHSSQLHSPKEVDRFRREAEFLAMLSHPHILFIYDFDIDEDEGRPYLVMEYAPNGSLRDVLNRDPQHLLPMAQSLAIVTQIGEALFYAHQKHIVHRDVKPENILFNAKGEALLSDFSIAIEQNITHMEQENDVIGTPSYMAPEQFDGHASRQSDQYALGCISYELLTGRRPFQAHTTDMLIQKHKYEHPTPPTQLNPLIPIHIEKAVLKAMAKSLYNRFENVSQFITALQSPSTSYASDTTVPNLSQMDKWQWLEEGAKLRKLQRYEAALEADEQALLLDSNFAQAYNNKGISLHNLKRYEAALEAYEHAIALDPHLAVAYNNKAKALFRLERFNEALSAFEKAILLDPTYAEAYYGKSRVLSKLTLYGEALASCKYAIRFDPKFASAYHGMAVLLIQFGQYSEALNAIETAIQIDAQQAIFHYMRGNILQRLGRTVEAQQAYEKGYQLANQA